MHLTKLQPCPTCDAFVRFHIPVEREQFLDQSIQFSPQYQLHFVKRDEGKNDRFQDMDREIWLVLMVYLEDAKNKSPIAKVVAGFDYCIIGMAQIIEPGLLSKST